MPRPGHLVRNRLSAQWKFAMVQKARQSQPAKRRVFSEPRNRFQAVRSLHLLEQRFWGLPPFLFSLGYNPCCGELSGTGSADSKAVALFQKGQSGSSFSASFGTAHWIAFVTLPTRQQFKCDSPEPTVAKSPMRSSTQNWRRRAERDGREGEFRDPPGIHTGRCLLSHPTRRWRLPELDS
jgi:hypothetical protein